MTQHQQSQAQAEQLVRDFAKQFPTPHVLEALDHCEAGYLSWDDAAKVFHAATIEALIQAKQQREV